RPDTLLNDRYRLEEPVGEGGMATVYRAVDTRLGRSVAVKVLHPEYARDQPFLTRFQQEAEFAASLGAHPNIVAIYDIGQDGGLHYIVMEYVEGRNLKDMIRESAPLPVNEAFSIGRQVASALDFAHKRGLVHRDIKPQNIMVTDAGVAKVTDFGIARSLSASQLTRTGMVIGTAHYFSPEQAQGMPAAPASDIYSLGVVLYEMLTGHLPFDADTPIGVAMQHLHSDPPPPWEYNPALSTRAAAVVLRALEKDPERRYRDAAEFASALADQARGDVGGTTTVSPIVTPPAQGTRVYRAVEAQAAPPAPHRVVEAPPRTGPSRPLPPPPPNQWRRIGLALGALLLAAGIAASAFFVTNRAFSGSPAPTSTPTDTPTAKPTRVVHRPRPTATIPVAVFIPTSTPYIPPATNTPRPIPPTSTPRPTEIPTAKPKPQPSPTPPPVAPTDTPQPLFPPPTSTPIG
ncbi:MAG TPA: protein kinase, partial [Chloroflexota bacterium]